MNRTDLAIEAFAALENIKGAAKKERRKNGILITEITVEDEETAKNLGKPCGRYLTFDMGNIAAGLAETDGAEELLAEEIRIMSGSAETVLVIGVGNTEITPDALGPRVADRVLATRHLSSEFRKSLGLRFKSVSVLSPGVLGRTGIESAEVIKAVCRLVNPQAVIAVDALAASDVKRLGTTVQISNAGISPGSGVGNRRKEISEKTLRVPVVAIGVPTVTDSANFGGKGGFLVTVRDIDLLISRAGELLSHSLNIALQPDIPREILYSLV